MYTLAAVCEELGVKCTGVPVGTIKKFATGRGNASKEEMIAAAKSRGFEPVDDNEADALAILFLALRQPCQNVCQKK
jgi:Holliday junction resolvasome RuvABC endonuclease subunit